MGKAHDLKFSPDFQSWLWGGFKLQIPTCIRFLWYHCSTFSLFNSLKAVYLLNLIPLS
jgi:quinol-cytochrome oxidoreductase complex cytochrome b subunit